MKFIAIVFSLLATTATAQPACTSYETIAKNLIEKYGEAIMFSGVSSRGETITIWMNRETGSWTAVARNGAIACVVQAGSGGETSRDFLGAPT